MSTVNKLSIRDRIDKFENRATENYKFKVTRRKMGTWVWAIIRLIILSGLAFIILYPILYMISISFRPVTQILDPTVVWIPRSLTLENIVHIVNLMGYVRAVWVTTYIGLFSAILQIITVCFAGYGFARFNFPFKKALFVILLFTIIVPPQSLLIPTYIMNVHFDYIWIGGAIIRLINLITGSDIPATTNVLGTPWAFWTPAFFASGIRSGLLIFIARAFFTNMPKELEEAAYIDGAGPIRTYFGIMIPNARPLLMTIFLFSMVWYWNDFFYAGTMLLDHDSTISVRLAQLGSLLSPPGQISIDPIALGAYYQVGSLLTVTPPLVMYIFFQRHFVESIERAGIVG